jgi:hypothetical protein
METLPGFPYQRFETRVIERRWGDGWDTVRVLRERWHVAVAVVDGRCPATATVRLSRDWGRGARCCSQNCEKNFHVSFGTHPLVPSGEGV